MLVQLLIVNAILGVILFELNWKKFQRFIHPVKEVNEAFQAWVRPDVMTWQKWKFYPGAMTVLIPRMILGCSIYIVCFMTLKVLMLCLCLDSSKPIERGLRKHILNFVMYFFS